MAPDGGFTSSWLLLGYPKNDRNLPGLMSDFPQNTGTPQIFCDIQKQFLPEMLESSVQKAHVEHDLARPRPFDGQLLHLTLDGITFDTGSHSRSDYCRGEMPTNGIIIVPHALGCVAPRWGLRH